MIGWALLWRVGVYTRVHVCTRARVCVRVSVRMHMFGKHLKFDYVLVIQLPQQLDLPGGGQAVELTERVCKCIHV